MYDNNGNKAKPKSWYGGMLLSLLNHNFDCFLVYYNMSEMLNPYALGFGYYFWGFLGSFYGDFFY